MHPHRPTSHLEKPLIVLLVGAPGAQRDDTASALCRDGHLVVQADVEGALSFLTAVRSEPASVEAPDRAVIIGADAEETATHLNAIWPLPCLILYATTPTGA